MVPDWRGPGEQQWGIEEAAKAASTEVNYQTQQWGEVEDTHDVEKEDVKRQVGAGWLMIVGEVDMPPKKPTKPPVGIRQSARGTKTTADDVNEQQAEPKDNDDEMPINVLYYQQSLPVSDSTRSQMKFGNISIRLKT
ncbi:hypothetical protein FN846DRAFT_912355 [Sphaerosporella brunnea]|uniref:Uncharacterized protein n=1 Tax=Sphaerosporella brunnea TaxID=1250544 RepID=A0A5J5EI48_9PEZI|nr:hypothetical protein FN846DRAFT_912355 [Sphaerosporella brunnea]